MFSRHANSAATTQLGCLRRERRDPLHEEEGADAGLLAEVHERLGERLRAQEDHRRPRTRAAMPTTTRRCVVGNAPISRAGPTRCGSSDGARRCGSRTARRSPMRITESKIVSVRLSGERQRVERGEARNVISIACGRSRCTSVSSSPVYPCLRGDARHPPRREQHDERPADADEQPVAAGHVGEREGRELLRVLARLGGEREVDRVLGKHRDQRQDREREALGHVELQRLRRPGQEERRSEDGEAEHDRGAHLAEAGRR